VTHGIDRNILQFINKGLVKKSKKDRRNRIKKHFGTAKVLTVEEALKIKENRKVKEQQIIEKMERAVTLRGKVDFAKMVWKGGYQIDIDLFS
jgi:hypothetical protein